MNLFEEYTTTKAKVRYCLERKVYLTYYKNAWEANYWGLNPFDKLFETDEQLEQAKALMARYKRFSHYMYETRHNWTKVNTLHFADNSTEIVEQSQLTGEKRNRMTVAPHGDVCF